MTNNRKRCSWLAKESEIGAKRLKNIISGTYLWEAELWPRYADLDAEVDKRLGDETTPQYRELIDNDFLHGRLNGAVFKN